MLADLPDFVRERLAAGHGTVVFIGGEWGEGWDDGGCTDGGSARAADAAVVAGADTPCRHAATLRDAIGTLPAAPKVPEAAVMSLADTFACDGKTDVVLGEACRHFPARLLIELQHESTDARVAVQAATRLFAFGFRRLGGSAASDRRRTWYEYSLRDYKPAPDWLNARFWANPERFDVQEDER